MDNLLDSSAKAARKFAEAPAHLINKLSAGKATPNMISVVGFLLHLPVAWLLAECYLVYAGLLLLLVAPIDVLDGALARIQKRVSDFGTVLDASLDRAKEVLLYSALAYHFAKQPDETGVVLAASALGLSILVSYIKAKGEMAIAGSSKQNTAELNRVFSSGLLRFEVRMLLLGIGLIVGYVNFVLIIIVIGSSFTALSRLFKIKSVIS